MMHFIKRGLDAFLGHTFRSYRQNKFKTLRKEKILMIVFVEYTEEGDAKNFIVPDVFSELVNYHHNARAPYSKLIYCLIIDHPDVSSEFDMYQKFHGHIDMNRDEFFTIATMLITRRNGKKCLPS